MLEPLSSHQALASCFNQYHSPRLLDNWATVAAINSGRAADPINIGSLQELWWIASVHDVQLEIRHKPGAEMIAADTLSRAAISSTAAVKFAQFAQAVQESEVQPPSTALLPPFPF